MFRYVCLVITLFAVACCATFEPAVRTEPPIAVPDRYSLFVADDPGPGKWWEAFGSDELNRLVEVALADNFDIRTAWSRLKQADAVARQAGADLMPSVEYGAGAEVGRTQTKTDETGTRRSDDQTFSAGVSAAYELDLWGRLNAARKSETLEYEAVGKDLEAAAVTVAAEVVTAWVETLSLRRQIAILQDQIQINQKMLKILELRFVNGQADALDVSQQREVLAAARANLPPLQLAEQKQRNALALLLGQSTESNLTISQTVLPEPIPLPATGLPADLLARRPDIRAAGLRLSASDWQVSAARADRLPAITLSPSIAFSSDTIDLLFGNWVASLAAGVTGPIFDGGFRSAELARTQAVVEETLTVYARVVAEAIQEVEDGLVTEMRQQEYLELLEDRRKTSRLTMKDARLQYTNGQGNYIDYLTAWTSFQELERQLVSEHAILIQNRVTLYRALGGDWHDAVMTGENAQSIRKTPLPR